MPARAFFSEKFWKGEVIVFQESDGYNTKKWEIKKKLEEQHHLEDEDEWKFFSRQRPMLAIGLFKCFNTSDPSETAYMKVYMQIPYEGSEYDPPSDRAEQRLPDAKIDEEFALITLTEAGCKSSPLLLNHKRATQADDSPYVPGGFIVYLVTEALPGIILDEDKYWELEYNERTKIRLAFKDAYEDCFKCGIVQTWGFLDTNLLWHETRETIFILGFSDSESATGSNAWDDQEWISWGFGQPVEGLEKFVGPLPPNMLRGREGTDTVWEF